MSTFATSGEGKPHLLFSNANVAPCVQTQSHYPDFCHRHGQTSRLHTAEFPLNIYKTLQMHPMQKKNKNLAQVHTWGEMNFVNSAKNHRNVEKLNKMGIWGWGVGGSNQVWNDGKKNYDGITAGVCLVSQRCSITSQLQSIKIIYRLSRGLTG